MARVNPGQWTNMGPEVKKAASYLTHMQRDCLFNSWSGMTASEAYKLAGGTSIKKAYHDSYVWRLRNQPTGRAFLDALNKRHAALLAPEQDAVRTEQDEAWARAVVTRNEALAKLSHIARANIKDIAEFKNIELGQDADGQPILQSVWRLKDAEDMPQHVAAAIKKVKATPAGITLELHDPIAAIQQIGKMLQWEAPQRVEGRLNVDVSAPEVAEAMKHVLDKL